MSTSSPFFHTEMIGPEYGLAGDDMLARASEGFCPNGCGPLRIDELHGRMQGSCYRCLLSWYTVKGKLWVCCCVPDVHTCFKDC
jgi:hypothetical protein